jgi:hypothetical protein
VIRDPYQLQLPESLRPGVYRLLVGMYTAQGRRPLIMPDGARHDSLLLEIDVR